MLQNVFSFWAYLPCTPVNIIISINEKAKKKKVGGSPTVSIKKVQTTKTSAYDFDVQTAKSTRAPIHFLHHVYPRPLHPQLSNKVLGGALLCSILIPGQMLSSSPFTLTPFPLCGYGVDHSLSSRSQSFYPILLIHPSSCLWYINTNLRPSPPPSYRPLSPL